MILIPLTQGQFAKVDDEDAARVLQFKWHAAVDGDRVYAARNIYREERRTRQYLHHFVLNLTGKKVDHRNGDGRDNQKDNLQTTTDLQNSRGFRRKIDQPFSKFRGVSWSRGMWLARLCVGNKRLCLGRFYSQEEAARARDEKARKLGWGEEGMNFPI